jgi:hypothetical protein
MPTWGVDGVDRVCRSIFPRRDSAHPAGGTDGMTQAGITPLSCVSMAPRSLSRGAGPSKRRTVELVHGSVDRIDEHWCGLASARSTRAEIDSAATRSGDVRNRIIHLSASGTVPRLLLLSAILLSMSGCCALPDAPGPIGIPGC